MPRAVNVRLTMLLLWANSLSRSASARSYKCRHALGRRRGTYDIVDGRLRLRRQTMRSSRPGEVGKLGEQVHVRAPWAHQSWPPIGYSRRLVLDWAYRDVGRRDVVRTTGRRRRRGWWCHPPARRNPAGWWTNACRPHQPRIIAGTGKTFVR